MINERTDQEKLAFVEGYNVCLSGMRRHKDLDEAIEFAEAGAKAANASLPDSVRIRYDAVADSSASTHQD